MNEPHNHRMKLKCLAASLCMLTALTTTITVLAQQNVDTIVTNGKILTVDASFRVVQALAINGGRIVASGTSAEMARHAGTSPARMAESEAITVVNARARASIAIEAFWSIDGGP